MLDQFYNYLSARVDDYFKHTPIHPGAKFNIQFENDVEVENLFNSLSEYSNAKPYKYYDENNELKYEAFMLDYGEIKIIVASTMNNVQPDFLTRLRNLVGMEHGYMDKGILFIHNTTLDSIVGGTESFSKEGMPFHVNLIQKDIQKKMAGENFSEVDQCIIELDLERKKSEILYDQATVFEYREILETIDAKFISQEQYGSFGLFYDGQLEGRSKKEIKKYLKDNASHFSRIDEIHNYGNPDTQLDRYYDDKGIEKLKKKDWKTVEYKDVAKSFENNKKIVPITYLGSNSTWDKEEGATKTKSRIRNILVFNEHNEDQVELVFNFDDFVSKNNLTTDGNLIVQTSGKKIKVILNNEPMTAFYRIKYADDKGAYFDFKIVMLHCSEKIFDSIKTRFNVVMKSKVKRYILIKTNDQTITLNESGSLQTTHTLMANKEKISCDDNEKLLLKLHEDFNYEDDSVAYFNIKVGNYFIPLAIEGTSEKIVSIEGLKVWNLKREKQRRFNFIGENRLQFGTKEYYTKGEFKRYLELEQEIIKLEGLCFTESRKGLEILPIRIADSVNQKFNDILDYYKLNKTVPSLEYLSDNLRSLYLDFLTTYMKELDDISEGSYLTLEQKNLLKLGVIYREFDDHELLLTPLHPLNIAYQLQVYKVLDDETMADDIVKKLSSTYLLPYLYNKNDQLYIPIEQYHSPEWKCYVAESLPRYKGSRDYVSKLVHQKLIEFTTHFDYMFNLGVNAPIKINLINTGDSKEILQGIFKYYVKQLKVKRSIDLIPIELYIYGNKNITTVFEEVAFNEDTSDIKKTYDLDLNVDYMSEEDVLNFYREKVNFYLKTSTESIEYSHITFIEMVDEVKTITSKSTDIPTGVMYDGLMSGVSSTFLGDAYRTGFGTKYLKQDTTLSKLSGKLNSVASVLSGEPYSDNQCKAISVSNKAKSNLEEVYNSSHWVTFINPKVDLNFFKNDPEAKDLLIIHYSDQYTTTGGYDAITVTRKSKPYQNVIEQFLCQNKIEDTRDVSPKIINMFNAINGDWLLKLLTQKSHSPKEKISILSAIKLGLAKFNTLGIIWIPISLEEILRVTGAAGLKQSEGLLSLKNLGLEKSGATSDDLLFIGVRPGDKTGIYYYPIEVKIGENKAGYIEKGIEQAQKTKGILDGIFLANESGHITQTQRIYRNFLMQLAITSAEKLKLYNVFPEINWGLITDSNTREDLLNEDYEILELDKLIHGKAGVISFKSFSQTEQNYIKDNTLVIERSEEEGINFITKSLDEIKLVISQNLMDSGAENIISSEAGNPGYITDVLDNVPELGCPFVEYEPELPKSNEDPIIMEMPVSYNPPGDVEVTETNDGIYTQSRNMEILFGHNVNNNKPVIWEPNNTDKVFHTNTGIIGTMGTGKTQFTKSLITQLYREQKYNVGAKDIGILIFDYKGDYNQNKTDFIEATNAKVYDLYHLPFNPLSLVKSQHPKPMLPLHTANSLKVTLAKAFGLGIKQETFLRDLIMEAYESRGIIKNKPDSWDNIPPTLKDVYDIYINHEDLKEDSLYAAFSNLMDFEIFAPYPSDTKGLFELIDGVTVIDLSGYDPDIQNLVVAITLDLFYSQMQANGHSGISGTKRQLNKLILVDEADNFLSKDFEALKKILKEGREFGVGTILSTQLLSHFSTGSNDYANYILTWIIHNVADLNNKDVKYIFNTQNKQEDEQLYNRIKSLTKHHSLVKMGDSNIPIHMRDRAFWELIE